MRVLAIEAATGRAGVAAWDSVTGVAAAIEFDSQRRLSQCLMPAITSLEGQGWPIASLDLLAVDIGPGSFTGLRVALAAAKGLAYSTGKPLVAAASLAILAAQAPPLARVVAVLDARGGEYYAAAFATDGDIPRDLTPITLLDASSLAATEADLYCGPKPAADLDGRWLVAIPRADVLARLAESLYLRDGAAELTAAKPHYVKKGQG